MTYDEFERRFLHLAYTTDIPLATPAIAYTMSVRVDEAQRHLDELVKRGVLELDSDERGSLFYVLPGRDQAARSQDLRRVAERVSARTAAELELAVSSPPEGGDQAALAFEPGSLRSQALQLHQESKEGRSALTLAMNLALPGVGSVVAGRPKTGWAQLSLFTAGLIFWQPQMIPLALAAWVWALATSIDVLTSTRTRR